MQRIQSFLVSGGPGLRRSRREPGEGGAFLRTGVPRTRLARRTALGLMAGALLCWPPPVPAGVCDGISPAVGTQLTTVRVASGLVRPTLAVSPPGDVSRLFILEQDGRIRILKDGVLLPTPFLDINTIVRSPADVPGGNEEGLLGLAFHPDYATNRQFFIYHTNTLGNNVVARYLRSTGSDDLADVASRANVIIFSHPTFSNHNGGMIAFGPDGMLYIGTGDGGSGCDPGDNAQDGTSLLGKMHRIDVSSLPYTIPADNPFVGNAGVADEIWSLGLRNPWRWSFDRLTGDLYIADVGQVEKEELNYRPASSTGGENYGWDIWEGDQCANASCPTSPANCQSIPIPNLVMPVEVFDHLQGCSVSGGYVYRGCRIPELSGTYFYSDYCAAFIRTFRIAGGVATEQDDLTAELAPGGGLSIAEVTSFGEDARGEVYIIDRGGEVFKILPVLSSLEVSGQNATPFFPTETDWGWEDLQATSMHPISAYRVYRSAGGPSPVFDCVFQGPDPVWAGGDADLPEVGAVFHYLVIGLNAAGQQTSTGTASDGSPRTLSAVVCPA